MSIVNRNRNFAENTSLSSRVRELELTEEERNALEKLADDVRADAELLADFGHHSVALKTIDRLTKPGAK